MIGGASEREARAFARGVRGDAPREILKFRPSAMAKNETKFVSCDKVCPIFIIICLQNLYQLENQNLH